MTVKGQFGAFSWSTWWVFEWRKENSSKWAMSLNMNDLEMGSRWKLGYLYPRIDVFPRASQLDP